MEGENSRFAGGCRSAQSDAEKNRAREVTFPDTIAPMKGLLIAFEGIDGAGKTTQARRLGAHLAAVGEDVLFSKEPTDGRWGSIVRASAKSGRLSFEEELSAFIADRQDHLAGKISPALEAGRTVIVDRYFYSTLAYQGIRTSGLSGFEPRVRENVIVPDIVLWLDVPVSIAMQRIRSRDGEGNLFEREDDLLRIGEIFREIAARDAAVVRIDATPPEQNVERAIMRAVVDGPWKQKRCAKAYGCEDPAYCGFRMTGTCRWAALHARLGEIEAVR